MTALLFSMRMCISNISESCPKQTPAISIFVQHIQSNVYHFANTALAHITPSARGPSRSFLRQHTTATPLCTTCHTIEILNARKYTPPSHITYHREIRRSQQPGPAAGQAEEKARTCTSHVMAWFCLGCINDAIVSNGIGTIRNNHIHI